MSRGCLLKLAALLVCARAYEDSESNPGITDDKNTAIEVIGELDYPPKISCVASEKPPPFVFWSHKTRSSAWLIKDSEYEETGNTLLIRSLATETLGQYTCQVYSSKGLEAPRVFNVRAYRPDGDISGGEWLVPRDAVSPIPETTSIATWTTTEDLGETDKLELELAASEGDQITLHCLLDSTLMAGDPLPKVTWKFGGVTIDGTAGRYRVTSDGALQIVSLYRNDTGVYTCVANNGLGEASQEIHLLVNDPVRTPVGIAGDENAVVTGELGQPLQVRCLAYGYPPPVVFWYGGYDGTMVPYHDAVYEARGNVLLIRSLAIEALGEYTCLAYNGEGKAASWVVFVRANMPEGVFIEKELLVPRKTSAPGPRKQPPTTTFTTTEAPRPMFTVPVSAYVWTPSSTLNIGDDLRLNCELDGFPFPDVNWTKDGVSIQPDDRFSIIRITFLSRLLVARVTVADSGVYACHASNAYSSQSDTAQINVQQFTIPAKCTDNLFFATCGRIVRSKFCRHQFYGKFCCKSCVEAGQLDPQEAALQADQPLKKK